MYERMIDQLHRAISTGVEERNQLEGMAYASLTEGFGDMQVIEMRLMGKAKSVKKKAQAMAELCETADPGREWEADILEQECFSLAAEAVKLCTAATRFAQTIREQTGETLLEMISDAKA